MAWFRRAWFAEPRPPRFPADMLQRMELFGRYELDPQGSGIDSSQIWQNCVAPFYEDSQADRDGFLTRLRTVVADDRGGFAVFGAARLVWELFGGDSLRIPAALPLIDAGIDFKLARGLSAFNITGYEQQRLNQRREQPS